MNIGCWEVPDWELGAVAEKYKKAKNIDPFDVSVDIETQTAIIYGSNEYHVSLERCSCTDFERRKRAYGHNPHPCKHMIRLAMELDVPFNLPEFNPEAAMRCDFHEDISRLADRWRAGEITDEVLKECSNKLIKCHEQAKRTMKRKR